jgi:microcystin-dependent protein
METLIASIMWVAFTFAPEGTVEANGQCMSINSNPALYSLLGSKYGGDNKTNFCVPDMRPIVNGQRDPNWNNGPRAVIVTNGIYPSRP